MIIYIIEWCPYTASARRDPQSVIKIRVNVIPEIGDYSHS
jgi:hypothetical protein